MIEATLLTVFVFWWPIALPPAPPASPPTRSQLPATPSRRTSR